MSKLEKSAVKVRFFKQGSVEQVDSIEEAANLDLALQFVRQRFPEAALVRCCEHEPDGGCLFVYANKADLTLDEADASKTEAAGKVSDNYGRWVGLISSAESEEPACNRPSNHRV